MFIEVMRMTMAVKKALEGEFSLEDTRAKCLTQDYFHENCGLAPFSKPMRPSDFVLFTLKLTLFLDFYAKVLLILFKRRKVLNRKHHKAESSNINS